MWKDIRVSEEQIWKLGRETQENVSGLARTLFAQAFNQVK